MRPDDPESLPRLGEFVVALAEGAMEELSGAGADAGALVAPLVLSRLSVDLPAETGVGEGLDGELVILAGPPTQRTGTTVFPVLNRVSINVALTDA